MKHKLKEERRGDPKRKETRAEERGACGYYFSEVEGETSHSSIFSVCLQLFEINLLSFSLPVSFISMVSVRRILLSWICLNVKGAL